MFLVAGCSAGQREQDAGQTADRFAVAVQDGDATGACALLAPHTREQLEAEGFGCEQALTGASPEVSEIGDVTVWGERAMAYTDAGTLFLAELGGGWKVVAAGCRPRGADLPYLCAVGGS